MPNGDLIATGAFESAGGMPAAGIARWNGSTWSALGTGITGSAGPVAILTSSDLIVGGDFTSAGGVPCNNIARWNGSSWSALGTGTDGQVESLAWLEHGDLAVGGQFSSAGGVNANNIAVYSFHPGCYANCDCSTAPPILNANDLQCFLNKYAAGDPYADCEAGGIGPISAFQCFLNAFATGCP
jgi:hypothetical protein